MVLHAQYDTGDFKSIVVFPQKSEGWQGSEQTGAAGVSEWLRRDPAEVPEVSEGPFS